MICASSIGEEQAACFEKVYYSVRFISKETQLKGKKEHKWKKDSSHISVWKKKMSDNSNKSTKKTVWIICVDIWKIEGNYLNLLTKSCSKHKFYS